MCLVKISSFTPLVYLNLHQISSNHVTLILSIPFVLKIMHFFFGHFTGIQTVRQDLDRTGCWDVEVLTNMQVSFYNPVFFCLQCCKGTKPKRHKDTSKVILGNMVNMVNMAHHSDLQFRRISLKLLQTKLKKPEVLKSKFRSCTSSSPQTSNDSNLGKWRWKRDAKRSLPP